MAAVVMLDVSGSMNGGPLNAIRAGLVKFASQVGMQDKAAIATVADEIRWDSNWNATPDQVRAALIGLKTRGSLTRLWDALLEAEDRYPETPIARRLVVISDGHDEGSQHTLDEVIAAAAKQHVVIDSIGMTRSDPKYLANLEKLSTATGGLHRAAQSLTMLEKLVGDGIERYRSMPVVTFRAEGVKPDGKAHPFVVTWKSAAAELQAQIETLVPEDPATSVPTPKVETKSDSQPVAPASKAEGLREKFEQIPKMYLMIGGGVLAALVLGLILFIVLRKGKKTGGLPTPHPQQQAPYQQAPPYQQQPPAFQPGPFQQPPQQQPQGPNVFTTGAFGQAPPAYPPPQQPAPFSPQGGGSTYQPLIFDPPSQPLPQPEPMQQPIEPRAASQPRFYPPSKSNPSAWLVCVEGPSTGRSFAIDEAQFWIGASPNNHLQLGDDPTVSGNHACIAFENDTLGVYDHRSTNGLFLNEERLTEMRRVLQPGDKLRIGRSTFVLQPASGNRTA